LTALSVNPKDAKISAPISSADPESFSEYEETKIQEPSSRDNKKPSKPKTKGWIGSLYVESIVVNDKPKFLCTNQDIISIKDDIEFEDEIIRPLDAEECGYYPYSFVGKEEELIADCMRNITAEEILDDLKNQIDYFIVAKPDAKTIIQGDLLLTYCQEWVSTVNFPFFVGETESGKSTGLHLGKWLGYRCLYGEDIPSADIYNFLGLDEEGSGMIAEDEAQDIWLNREKMNMYKNSYSKGSKKSRIVGVDSLKRKQVHYKTFCPKWFAGERIPGNKGFMERLAIIYMVEGQPKGNIKRPTKDEVHQVNQLRNKLLIWKLQNIGKEFPIVNSGLKGRDQELWEDFLSLGSGTKYEEDFQNTVLHYTEQRHNKIKNSIEAKLFKFVCDNLNKNMELIFTEYWDCLTSENTGIPGKLSDRGPNTFFADDHPEKITPQFLAKLFEYKFQGMKETIKKKDNHNHQRQTTIYRFKKDVMEMLVKKYGTDLPLDHILYLGELGQHGGTIDQVDEVDQFEQKEKNYRCQDCNTEFRGFSRPIEYVQTIHVNGTHKIVEIAEKEMEN